MSWGLITEDWRLKLLALGLAVLMLGAVAFSQNPPTTGSKQVPLAYVNIPPNLILISPPSQTTLSYFGVADVIKNVKVENLSATVDVSHAKPGSRVALNVKGSSTIGDLRVQNPSPINVDIDNYTINRPIQVQVSARAGTGWSITKTAAQCPGTPCTVNFSGPESWTKNMTAVVTYPTPVNVGTTDSPNQRIQLFNSNGGVDLACRTDPCATLDPLTANIHIEAVAGSNSSTVPLLDAPPSHGPANGYRVTAIDISPNTVIISGDPTALGRIRSITLPAVDLSGRTSTYTAQVSIPYPADVTGNVAIASVKYTIAPNPNVTSPSP